MPQLWWEKNILRDTLNTRIVQGFVYQMKWEIHHYTADNYFWGQILTGTLRTLHAAYPIQYDRYAIGLLSLVPGIKVIITDNIAMQGGVGNGCIGTLQDIKYELNKHGEQCARGMYMHVSGSTIQASGLPPDVIPLLPEWNSFK